MKSVKEKFKELEQEDSEEKRGWTEEELKILSNPNLSNRECARLTGKRYHNVRAKRFRMNVTSVSSYSSSKLNSDLKLVMKDYCPICNNNALFYNERTDKYLCTLCNKEFYWQELN